jgi:prepilin-type N-terminal cleavage/methylation domain-containing protein
MNITTDITRYARRRASYRKGMTLVELLVVLAIFLMVAGLTIFDYGSFRSTASLQNLADDIGLSVRRAQSKAIGVGNSSLLTFANGYGIHFSTDRIPAHPLAGSSKSFIIFNDIADSSGIPNKIYDYDSGASGTCDASTLRQGNECVDLLNITTNDKIEAICPNSDQNRCAEGSADITFLRPNPDAYICVNTTGEECALKSVDIVIKNIQSGSTKTITVSNAGQINIK